MVLGIGIPTMGIAEWVIILVIVFLLFGAKRLPEIGKGIGEGIKNFRGASAKESARGSRISAAP